MLHYKEHSVPLGQIDVDMTHGYMWSYVPDPSGNADKTYRSTDIQKIAMVTKMQLVHWTQTGAIIPLEDARGRGSRRVYNRQNLMEALICRELSKFSIETHVMHEVLSMLRENTYKFEFSISQDQYPPPFFGNVPLNKIRSAVLKKLNRDPETEPFTVGKLLGLKFFEDPPEEIKTAYYIDKHHTFWEFVTLYGIDTGALPFLLVSRKEHGKVGKYFDCSLIDDKIIHEKLNETPCSLVIDLIHLLKQVREY